MSVPLLELRLAVLVLGERAPTPWWSTRVMDGNGQAILARIMPRTALQASFWTGSLAARRVHDAHVGTGDVTHLFRLPFALEEELGEALLRHEDELRALLDPALALERLRSRARGQAVSPAEGPVRVGVHEDLTRPRGAAVLAARYLDAIERETRVYPYASGA